MILRTPEEFGMLIRSERQLWQISQAQMAASVGVSRRWLIDFENGKITNPSLNTIMQLLCYLGLGLNVTKLTAIENAPAAKDLPTQKG